jgi:hypothetical protein
MASRKLAKWKPEPEQVDRVCRWILAGGTEAEIEAAIAKEWPEAAAARTNPDQPHPIVMAAAAKFRECGEFDGVAVLGFCYEATRELYRQLLKEKNFIGALKAIKQMSDIAEKRL